MMAFFIMSSDKKVQLKNRLSLVIFMGTQETIIYRLVVINPSYDAYFSFLIFWVTFCDKLGVASPFPF